MRRKWQVGRVVLAGVVLAGAALLWLYWPHAPLWHAPADHVVGFDEEQSLVYSAAMTSAGQVLRAHDVRDGEVRSQVSLLFPRTHTPLLDWPCVLAPGGKTLVAASTTEMVMHLVGHPDAAPVTAIRFPSGERTMPYPEGTGFSGNGRFLAVTQVEFDGEPFGGERLRLYDLRKQEEVNTALVPYLKHVSHGGIRGNSAPPATLAVTNDGRFVAAGLCDWSAVLFDLAQRRVALRVQTGGSPCFSGSGDELMLFPRGVADGEGYSVRRFRRDGEQWREVATGAEPARPGEYVLEIGRDVYVTAVEEPAEPVPDWVSRLPSVLAEWYWELWGRDRLRCTVRESWAGGGPRREVLLSLRGRSVIAGVKLGRLISAKIALGGEYVAILAEGELRLFETRRSFPLSCWLTCSALALLAGWVAWPRKVKYSGAHRTADNLLPPGRCA